MLDARRVRVENGEPVPARTDSVEAEENRAEVFNDTDDFGRYFLIASHVSVRMVSKGCCVGRRWTAFSSEWPRSRQSVHVVCRTHNFAARRCADRSPLRRSQVIQLTAPKATGRTTAVGTAEDSSLLESKGRQCRPAFEG